MSVYVRLAVPDDLEWCIEHDHLVSAEIVRRKVPLEEIIVGEIDGQRCAYLRLEYLWSRLPYIGLIWVAEDRRNEGIGRAVLGFTEQFLRGRGHKMLLSSSQADESGSQAWHRSVGFGECGILAGINEGGIGEIFFSKPLA